MKPNRLFTASGFAIWSLLLLMPVTASAALKVFACEPEWAALAQELAADATIYSATTAYQDPHHIEARPSLVAKLRSADLLICSGSELEIGWLPVLLRQAGNPRVQADQAGYLMASEHVQRLEQYEKVDRSMGDVHAAGNPHVHLDPHRLLQIAEVLRDRLLAIDPVNAEAYRHAYLDFARRWAVAIEDWQLRAASLAGVGYVSYHKNFSYLADWLGMQRLATVEPKPGIPPSAKHIQELQQALQGEPVLAVLNTPAQAAKHSERLAAKLAVPAITLPFSPGMDQAADLFALFEATLEALLKAQASQQALKP